MITKYVKHTNQKVHCWNLVTKPKTQTIFLSLKSNRNFIFRIGSEISLASALTKITLKPLKICYAYFHKDNEFKDFYKNFIIYL